MDSSEFLEWLRMYRHDLMNDLQLVQGYATMGKHDASQEKLQQLIERLNQERLVQTLDAPLFVRWLLTFPLQEKLVDVQFKVELDEAAIQPFDQAMVADSEAVIDQLTYNQSSEEPVLLIVHIYFEGSWYVEYEWHDPELEVNQLQKLQDMKHREEVIQEEKATRFVFKYE
ncbi:Spo0B domain-containing protein [Halalkalibacillus halophilus]|uniref:Spo0B domain-containing protein n=1 Tax=Halalkalibacillus halophilus TaxID=392827 RepID=UPI0003F63A18|nr:Spo0B domain-containing protein [Halalkalibacillus halophilus]